MTDDERRRFPRVAFSACATLWLGAAEMGVYRVSDLSAGGALLEGKFPAPAGQQLTASFHLSGFEVTLGAVIVRNEYPRAPFFALSFEVMSPESREWIRMLVQETREPAYDASDLVVREADDVVDGFQVPFASTEDWPDVRREHGLGR